MSSAQLPPSSDTEYDTPEKRKNKVKVLIVQAIVALRNLSLVPGLEENVVSDIKERIQSLNQMYFQLTNERIEEVSVSGGEEPVARTGEMGYGGHRRIRKSSVQRRKHHSNKKGKTVRRKMTRTCARRSRW